MPVVAFSSELARFWSRYPGAWMNPAYPTADRIIPAAWFDLLASEGDAVDTGQQLRTALAVAHGTAMVQSSDSKVRSLTAALQRRAFPLIRRVVEPRAPDPTPPNLES